MSMLRATDPETARVVAIHADDGTIVGSGCLIDHEHILTCRHVVRATKFSNPSDWDDRSAVGHRVLASLVGLTGLPTVKTQVINEGGPDPSNDLALLRVSDPTVLGTIEPIEFVSPLRHGGKSYSVLGFPSGDSQGRNVMGTLHSADARGLIQMDRGGALSVLGGFSGAPVWSQMLSGFVGIVVTELATQDISWCIPSRKLCEFFPDLGVRFRIPPCDRPIIHDRTLDDPNLVLFGQEHHNGGTRNLVAKIREHSNYYTVKVKYMCVGQRPRGRFVTFITYPDFKEEHEDAYELFAEVEETENGWMAKQEFYPEELFTVAAIGDGGDTVLTLDLEKLLKSPRHGSTLQKKNKKK